MITVEELKKDEEVIAYYEKGNQILGALGYTDHSMVHASLVSAQAMKILRWMEADPEIIQLAGIAGILHDIGNAVNRSRHAEFGALIANEILRGKDISVKDRITVVSAIANHDESTGMATDPVSAALILADKSDVRRNRVREKDKSKFDIHDRVNYAVTQTALKYDPEQRNIKLNLEIDNEICTMFDYFEIFTQRMLMCGRAAQVLNAHFRLTVNGQKVL